MPTTDWKPEATIAETLGLPLPRLRELRSDLLTDSEWKKNGRIIELSPEAEKKIAAAISPSHPLDLEADPEPDIFVSITVTRIPINPRIVFGAWMGERVRVRVPDSTKFIPGMKLKAVLIEADLYQLAGRGPRFKGRW